MPVLRKIFRLALLTCAPLLVLPAFGTSAVAQLRGHGGPVRALAISPDGRPRLPAASIRPRSAGRWRAMRPSRCFVSMPTPSTRWCCSGTGARRPQAPTGASRSGLPATPSPMPCWKAIPRRSQRLRYRLTARRWLRHHGIKRSGCGRSQAARRACSKAIARTSMAWRSRPMAARWSASATIRAYGSGRCRGVRPNRRGDAGPLNAVAIGRRWRDRGRRRRRQGLFPQRRGCRTGEIAAGPRPVISLAISSDGAMAAAASIGGSVAVIERKTRALARRWSAPGFRCGRSRFCQIAAPCSPAAPTTSSAAGTRRPASPSIVLVEAAGDPLAAYAGDHGADMFRACVACHTLGADQANRAGPTLAGIFGRRIATLPGYNFSDALKQLDIVWTPETVSKLFEIGPAAYTPGHQDARATHRFRTGPCRIGAVPGTRDEAIEKA